MHPGAFEGPCAGSLRVSLNTSILNWREVRKLSCRDAISWRNLSRGSGGAAQRGEFEGSPLSYLSLFPAEQTDRDAQPDARHIFGASLILCSEEVRDARIA